MARRPNITASKPAAPAPRTPPPSKGELRALIEKLETVNATLRAKNREANRATKAAAARIAELEGDVRKLEARSAGDHAATARSTEAKATRRGRPPGRGKIKDPGAGATAPGDAMENPQPADEEAIVVREP